jgi:hypothetical protein
VSLTAEQSSRQGIAENLHLISKLPTSEASANHLTLIKNDLMVSSLADRFVWQNLSSGVILRLAESFMWPIERHISSDDGEVPESGSRARLREAAQNDTLLQ